jgi:phenylalanyl-tRNA synthetase alpha chain
MLDKVSELIGDVQAFKTTSKEEIETFRIKYLGNKGLLKELFAEFKNVDTSIKKDLGQALNNLRNAATNKVQELKDSIEDQQATKSFYGDLTRPSEPIQLGSRHPISLVRNRII